MGYFQKVINRLSTGYQQVINNFISINRSKSQAQFTIKKNENSPLTAGFISSIIATFSTKERINRWKKPRKSAKATRFRRLWTD